jgi:hypothetical protein
MPGGARISQFLLEEVHQGVIILSDMTNGQTATAEFLNGDLPIHGEAIDHAFEDGFQATMSKAGALSGCDFVVPPNQGLASQNGWEMAQDLVGGIIISIRVFHKGLQTLDKAVNVGKNEILTVHDQTHVLRVVVARIKLSDVLALDLEGAVTASSGAAGFVGLLAMTALVVGRAMATAAAPIVSTAVVPSIVVTVRVMAVVVAIVRLVGIASASAGPKKVSRVLRWRAWWTLLV